MPIHRQKGHDSDRKGWRVFENHHLAPFTIINQIKPGVKDRKAAADT